MNFYDGRGTLIKVGQRVAYNFSGEIAVGTIESIKEKEIQYWYSGSRIFPHFKIKQEYPELYKGRTSLVKNNRSLLVLKDNEAV